MYGRMTDIADREGGARRAWAKGARAQRGQASKRSRNLMVLAIGVLVSNLIHANPYTLEYAITGTETTSMVNEEYHVEAGWGETPDVLHNEPFETAPEVYAYLMLLTDVITGDSAVLLTEGADLGGGWMRAGWFGVYNANSYPWVFHPNLGWVYVTEDRETGTWLHRANMEWLWTKPRLFPSMYVAKRQEWTFLDMAQYRTTFYDYGYDEWFEADRLYSILGGAVPGQGGSVAGLGYYYRWDPVVLEARASDNYKFVGWGVDLDGAEPVHTFEAVKDMQVEASFLAIPSANSSAQEVVSGAVQVLEKMDHLTETEKKKSLAELLIFGKSATSGLSIVD